MPRNKIIDLTNHLFEQMERLNDDKLNDLAMEREVERAKAMSQIASSIINSYSVAIKAMNLLQNDSLPNEAKELIGLKESNEKNNSVSK